MVASIVIVTILFGAGLWLFVRSVPIFTLGDRIQPNSEDELDDETLRAYAAEVQAATGGRSVGAYVRRRLFLSFAGLALMLMALGMIAGTLWLAWG